MHIDSNKLGEFFGIVSMGNQTMLEVVGNNLDISVGEIFLIHSRREGHERIFFFRTLEQENIIRHIADIQQIAGTLVVESDAYLAGIQRNMLLSIGGKMLGYAEYDEKRQTWVFRAPRRLPDHLAKVYRPKSGVSDEIVRRMLADQIGGNVFVGHLHVGEKTLDVPISIPSKFLPMHVGIFGSTGAGKSNLMMVLIKSFIDNNLEVFNGRTNRVPVSAFCIDPHDEFAQGVDKFGIQNIIDAMDSDTRSLVIGDFYYLTTYKKATPREIQRYTREMRILWNEIQPSDIFSIMDFSPQMAEFVDAMYAQHRENWIKEILQMAEDPHGTPAGTLRAVQRRLRFLERSVIFARQGDSILPALFEAMETGRVLVVNTSLMSDREQFLLTTIVTRTLSDLRRAMKSSRTLADFDRQCRARLPSSLYEKICKKARAFYGVNGTDDNILVRDTRELPAILITVEEAPSILNPELMRGQSVFKDIARQGRKFNIGLLVISQQVSVLDNVILSQINTEINLRLGNEREIQACIDNASINISGFEEEFRVMSRGEAIVTASYRDLPLPVRIPLFDEVFERDREKYSQKSSSPQIEHVL